MSLDKILEVIGAVSVITTTLASLFPQGSRIGYWLAKIGTDLKGHTSPTLKD